MYFKFLFSEEDVSEIVSKSDGYSGADMANLCREAAMGPIRSMDLSLIENMDVEQVIKRKGSIIAIFFFRPIQAKIQFNLKVIYLQEK